MDEQASAITTYHQEYVRSRLVDSDVIPRHIDKATELCCQVMGSCKDGRQKATVLEIFESGTIKEQPLPDSTVTPKYNWLDPIYHKFGMAKIFRDNPDLAQNMCATNAAGVHGTSSGALFNILKRGKLLPLNKLEEQGELLVSGERYKGRHDMPNVVSFARSSSVSTVKRYICSEQKITPTTLREENNLIQQSIAEDRELGFDNRVKVLGWLVEDNKKLCTFLEKEPESEEEKLQQELIRANFPVAFFTSNTDDIDKSVFTGLQDEFVIPDEVSLKDIPIIAVPKDHIDQIKQLLDRYGQNHIAVHSLKGYIAEE